MATTTTAPHSGPNAFKRERYLTRNGERVETNGLPAGDYYLVRVQILGWNSATTRYQLEENCPTTNMRPQRRVRGWLGCTNNVDRYACGRVRLERADGNRVRLTQLSDEDES
jgi:hypothetical protein